MTLACKVGKFLVKWDSRVANQDEFVNSTKKVIWEKEILGMSLGNDATLFSSTLIGWKILKGQSEHSKRNFTQENLFIGSAPDLLCI